VKRRKTIYKIWVFLFCIAVTLTGMYTSGREIDSALSYTDIVNTLSAAARSGKSFDMADDSFITAAGEVKSSFTDLSKGTRSIRIYSENSFYPKTVLSTVSLTAWAVLTVSQWNALVDRLYLIIFIHNSDGKKGGRRFF
jgi:hypothetical protein